MNRVVVAVKAAAVVVIGAFLMVILSVDGVVAPTVQQRERSSSRGGSGTVEVKKVWAVACH